MENSNTLHQMIYKEVTHIENVPEEWKHTNDWDSHRELIWTAINKLNGIDGWRVECGCGDGATDKLNKYYEGKGGFVEDKFLLHGEVFISYETNEKWSHKYNGVSLVGDYFDAVFVAINNLTLLFVDCAPAEIRKDIIRQHRDVAKVIVVHDSEIGAEYCYALSDVLSTFKYRLDYKPEGCPHTTAVSNFINVTDWV